MNIYRVLNVFFKFSYVQHFRRFFFLQRFYMYGLIMYILQDTVYACSLLGVLFNARTRPQQCIIG